MTTTTQKITGKSAAETFFKKNYIYKMQNEETISLPNNDNGSEVSDHGEQTITVLIRLTPDGAYTKEDLTKFLNEQLDPSDQWVVGVEVLPQVHYHLVLSTADLFENIKLLFRTQIHLWYPKPRARGFGNKQWNCQQADTPLENCIAYALKDKIEKFWFGFDEAFIKECEEASFPKNSPKTFKIEYLELCEEFQISDMDVRSFMIKYSILKSKYNQQVRMHDAYGYAISNLIRRDPIQAEDLVENYLYKM